MTVIFTEQIKSETGSTFAATCGKVDGVVSFSKYGVQVLCVNASHKVWRGGGKHFPTLAQALDNYKSPEMRAIIRSAATEAGVTI